jgi:hypothetical protein
VIVSDEKPLGKQVTLTIRATDFASKNLNARIAELKRRDKPFNLDAVVEGVQFLRGVGSRASEVLPTFYILVGSSTAKAGSEVARWKPTQSATLNRSALRSISLICRSIFDDSRKGMTGKRFANISDATLGAIAEHWSRFSKRPVEDASKALTLLRGVFQLCAQPRKTLLNSESLLERRIGLLKYHADHEAAHITLEPFLLDTLDIVHVVAAIAILGAIIVDFDQPQLGDKYFDSLDEAGWSSAKAIFPEFSMDRLFLRFAVHEQARGYWKHPEFQGLKMLLTQLPAAIGYWDSRDDSVVASEPLVTAPAGSA